MEYKINVRVSNRHVHLTKEVYDKLFDHAMTKKYDLKQIGEYATNEVVTIKNGDKEIPNVRVVGPIRKYNQVEISKRDARLLGVNPPVRRSGDIVGSADITLVTEKGEVTIKSGLIIANRHIHMNEEDCQKYGVKDRQIVSVEIPGAKRGIVDAEIKVSANGYYEMHIDNDDANAFLVEDNDIAIMIVK